MSDRSFHETPLVVFTALAIVGCGVAGAYLPAWIVGWRPFLPTPGVSAAAGAILGVGLLVSLGHLGRPLRMLLTLRGLGRSPLSNEVLLAGAAFAALSATAFVPVGGPIHTALWVLAVVASLAALVAVGRVYRLHGRVGWRGSAVFHPLLLGIAVGLLALLARASDGEEAELLDLPRGEVLGLLVLFLALDAVAGYLRGRRVMQGGGGASPSHPALFRRAQALLVSRFVSANAGPAILALSGRVGLALLLLLIGIVVDRICFYGLGLQQSTESEITRVQDLWSARKVRSTS